MPDQTNSKFKIQNSILLRAVEPSDAEFLYLAENDDPVSSDYVAPLSRRQLEEYARNYQADPFGSGELRLIVECDGQPIGMVDLYDISLRDMTASLAIYIAPDARRNGLGRSAVEAMERYAFSRLGLEALCARISAGNIVSRRLFGLCGWRMCGSLPSWRRALDGRREDLTLWVKTRT